MTDQKMEWTEVEMERGVATRTIGDILVLCFRTPEIMEYYGRLCATAGPHVTQLAIGPDETGPEVLKDALEQTRPMVVPIHAIHREPVKCCRCGGCGKIANSEAGEPWTQWENLPPGSDAAVRMGLIKPIRCAECGGAGYMIPEMKGLAE